jgi:hypothetical protein
VEGERRTWVWLLVGGLLLGLALAGVLVFIGAMWYAFGLFGTLVVITGVAIGAAWLQDRRNRRADAELRGL